MAHEGTLQLTIVTPTKKMVQGMTISEVTLPGAKGQLQILPQHTELMTVVDTGIVSYHEVGNPKPQVLAVSYGTAEVHNNKVLILAETAEFKEEIDKERARRAQEKAEKVLREGGVDLSNMRKYELKLERALVRQTAANT